MSDLHSSNAEVIQEFRQNGGIVGGFYEGASLLLLTTIGRRSGRAYTVALAYQVAGDRLIVVPANIGAGRNPDWYHNLMAHPEATVELGTETVPVIASLVQGEERDRILAASQQAWTEAMARYPDLPAMPAEEVSRYPVIALTPRRTLPQP
ncbi:MAG: nitroreductase/quinone reductase family protein [Chloroflexota bacterium]